MTTIIDTEIDEIKSSLSKVESEIEKINEDINACADLEERKLLNCYFIKQYCYFIKSCTVLKNNPVTLPNYLSFFFLPFIII